MSFSELLEVRLAKSPRIGQATRVRFQSKLASDSWSMHQATKKLPRRLGRKILAAAYLALSAGKVRAARKPHRHHGNNNQPGYQGGLASPSALLGPASVCIV